MAGNKVPNSIKNRKVPITQQSLNGDPIPKKFIINDEFYTPIPLVVECIKYVYLVPVDVVLDSAYGTGNFYNNYPSFTKNLYTEDFFNFNEKVDWIITNPPYSKIDKYLEHSCKICRKGFAYLLAIHNLTPKRLIECEKEGFFLEKMLLCKVDKWYGCSVLLVFSNQATKCCIDYQKRLNTNTSHNDSIHNSI